MLFKLYCERIPPSILLQNSNKKSVQHQKKGLLPLKKLNQHSQKFQLQINPQTQRNVFTITKNQKKYIFGVLKICKVSAKSVYLFPSFSFVISFVMTERERQAQR